MNSWSFFKQEVVEYIGLDNIPDSIRFEKRNLSMERFSLKQNFRLCLLRQSENKQYPETEISFLHKKLFNQNNWIPESKPYVVCIYGHLNLLFWEEDKDNNCNY